MVKVDCRRVVAYTQCRRMTSHTVLFTETSAPWLTELVEKTTVLKACAAPSRKRIKVT